MDVDEVRDRFTYHPPASQHVAETHERIRRLCGVLAVSLLGLLPDCDETRHAIDALDDTCKHANAAVARHPDGLPEYDGWRFPADLLEAAWGLIANAGGGNWDHQTAVWQQAAVRWRDAYHATLPQPAGGHARGGSPPPVS